MEQLFFARGDRNENIKKAIRVGLDKNIIADMVFQQQSDRDIHMTKKECKELVWGLASEIYRQELQEARAAL